MAREGRREEIIRDDRDRGKFTGRRWKAWEYRRWVEEGLIGEIEDPFEAVKWQQVLGGEGFLRKLKDHWNQRVERPKNYGQKRNWSAFGAELVLERVSEHFQSDLETLKKRGIRGNAARRCAIYAVLGSRWVESLR